MFRATAVIGALALLTSPVRAAEPAQAPTVVMAAAPTAETRALAKALVAADGARERSLKGLDRTAKPLAGLIVSELSLKDEAQAAKVRALVRDRLIRVIDAVIEIKTDAYASHFSVDELRFALAFETSPTGQAAKAVAPELTRGLTLAITSSSDERAAQVKVFTDAPAPKRELVSRILAAQDLETQTRKGLGAMSGMMDAVISASSDDNAQTPVAATKPAPPSAEEVQAVDELVARMMEAGRAFYVTRFTEAQLADLAAYYESSTAKAMRSKSPQMQAEIYKAAIGRLPIVLPKFEADVCATVACTAEQRTKMAAFSRKLGRQIPAMFKVFFS
jgi:hypothetical protein